MPGTAQRGGGPPDAARYALCHGQSHLNAVSQRRLSSFAREPALLRATPQLHSSRVNVRASRRPFANPLPLDESVLRDTLPTRDGRRVLLRYMASIAVRLWPFCIILREPFYGTS